MNYKRNILLMSSLLAIGFGASTANAVQPSPEQKKIIQQVQVDQVSESSDRLYKLDSVMQENYAKTQYEVGQMQSPVILALFNGSGGKYILRRNGKQVAVEPVPPIYKKIKSVSHTLVGIFEIVSPYFEYSESGNWRTDLSEYNDYMKEALATLGNTGMPAEFENNCRIILEGGIAFMDQVLKSGKFTADDYSNYAKPLLPTVMKNVTLAGKLQVDHFEEVVKQWRKEMGEEEWSRLYAVVNSAWAMRRQNVHFQIMAQMMGQDTVNDRLIMAEAINDVTEDDLLMLLGRVVNDRVLSILVFDETFRMDVELMGEAARKATEEAACPIYPAMKNEWMPYEEHKMPNEK
ncbi:MAG: hypothetical protein P8M22_08250 [Phycisphaerales bacterium]|nr:hypothetical protein [Phycisphaerales bacterium]